MPLTPADSGPDDRPRRVSDASSTHHFVSDPYFHVPLYENPRWNEQQLSSVPIKPEVNAFLDSGANGTATFRSKPTSDRTSGLVAPAKQEIAEPTRIVGGLVEEEPPRKLNTNDDDETISVASGELLTKLDSIDRDETISVTSDESDGNVSIPHGELNDETESIPIHLDSKEDGNVPGSAEMPLEAKAQLDAWYAVRGRGMPPCATSTPPEYLNSRNVLGEPSYFVHKSGERLKICMYPLFDVLIPKNTPSKQRIIVAQGRTQGPFIIKYASQKNGRKMGTSYKIWRGVKGGDKDGFEPIPSVFKRYKSTGSKPKKPTHDDKKVALKTNGGFRGNQFYAADGTPKSGTDSKNDLTVTSLSAQTSSYDFRPSKRQKQDEESSANYSKLLAAFSSSAEPTSGHKEGVIEHMQNNAVFLFYSKKSPQPRARLFSACNTMQKLFAQALAGDVFDQDMTAAKVLSMRVAGQQKPKAVVEDDEQDFEDMVEALKSASCWITSKGGETSGSCTVEVRAR